MIDKKDYTHIVYNEIADECFRHVDYFSIAYRVETVHAKCDVAIYKDNKTIAIVEIQQNVLSPSEFDSLYSILVIYAKQFNSRFIILAEDRIYHIQDLILGKREDFNKQYTLAEIVEQLIFAPELQFKANSHLFNIQSILRKYNICIDLKEGSLRYDSTRNTVSFIPSIESKLFEKIIGCIDSGEIFRFSSMETLFYMLNKESVRLVALDGMNDKEDGDFLWKNLYGYDAKIDEYKKQDETAYVLSCSNTDENDLNMWRLYANDTCGMCLKMSVDSLHLQEGGFTLANVVYSDNEKLQCLKEIIAYFRRQNPSTTFVLQQWNVWRAFFKNKDYKVEHEVRLLYLKTKDKLEKEGLQYGWLLTNDCKVFSEYVDFTNERAEQFPLKIKQIILGPNAQEKDTNKKQITQMIKEKSRLIDSKCKREEVVSVSNITSYRTGKK